ncbi:MAG: hypothetical protein EPN82_01955 [Bacteroidetes bacterium]|nr:MAG: hypothetical protein EPN82_01955 [Bacteroidota bacterium]
MPEDKLLRDLNKSKIYIIGANSIASIVFALVAFYLKNYWLIIPVVLLIITSVSAVIFYKKIENKYRDSGIIK